MEPRGSASRRAKRGVRQILDLHKQMNPDRGLPILVAIDPSTNQLFFCSAKGSVRKRDQLSKRVVAEMVYEAWPALRPAQMVEE